MKKVSIVIKANARYGSYLAKHLQKEHPATKGKIKIFGGRK